MLHESSKFAAFETNAQHLSPDQAVREFITLAKALPPELAAIWRGCDRRTFNIGFAAGTEPHCVEHVLSFETVAAIAEIKAEIAISIYAAKS